MTRYLLDTNIVSGLIGSPRYTLVDRLKEVGPGRAYVSIVVAGELRFGAVKRRSARLSAEVEAVLSRLEVAPVQAPADRIYGDLRAALERGGEIIGANDLWIAAQALAEGSVLVTDNVKEFSRIPQLVVENWLRA